MLSDPSTARTRLTGRRRLNAPYGARCFLTGGSVGCGERDGGLNAPFGAWCFLTPQHGLHGSTDEPVLIHLMALGAF